MIKKFCKQTDILPEEEEEIAPGKRHDEHDEEILCPFHSHEPNRDADEQQQDCYHEQRFRREIKLAGKRK